MRQVGGKTFKQFRSNSHSFLVVSSRNSLVSKALSLGILLDMNRGDPTSGTRSPSVRRSSSKSEVKECRRDSIFFGHCVAICLQEIKSRGMLPCCSHEFCYVCILEWSKVTNECPLCKRSFHEIQVMNVS